MGRRWLIDCDPGIDDALALYAALANDQVTVQGLTTVYGNVTVRQATRNVARLLHLLARPPSIPIGEGAEEPLVGSRLPRRTIHGRDGLGDLEIPGVLLPKPQRQSLPLVTGLLKAGAVDDIVALGPLTNLAHLFASAPRLLRRVQRVVVMGGVVDHPERPTSASEFNLASDPAAARCLLRSGVPLQWVPLDVAGAVVIHHDAIERLGAVQPRSPLAVTIARLLSYGAGRREREGAIVPDAVAVALAMDPTLGTWRLRRLAVEGRMRIGRLQAEPGLPNAQVCEAVNVKQVEARLCGLWSRLVERDVATRVVHS